MNLTDIHCHLIPYVDDGAKSFDEMRKLLALEQADGIRRIILTPHYHPGWFEASPRKIRQYYELAKHTAVEYGIHVYLGCEFYRHAELIDVLKSHRGRTMHGGKYVLIEFAPGDRFSIIRNSLYELLMNGYLPILAHVERYMECRDVGRMKELGEMGVFLQVNASALLGKQGRTIKHFVWKLIKEDLVDFIASDAHDIKYRAPNLGKVIKKLQRKKGREYVHRIFVENPDRIIKSKIYDRRNTDEKN